jgi:hypothetical protein
LYKENEALKKSIQPDQTAGNIIGEVVTNGLAGENVIEIVINMIHKSLVKCIYYVV